MRILFGTLHPGYYRNIDSVVEELAQRGHEVHLGVEREESGFGGQIIIDRLTSRYPNVTSGRVPMLARRSLFLATRVRLALDYLRFLEPIYPPSSGLRARAQSRAPTGILRLEESGLLSWRWVRRLFARALTTMDRALPPSPEIEAYLDVQRPDVVVITPLIGMKTSSQIDLFRSAQNRRMPTAVFVWSWDHLSSKATIRDCPNALFVWNDAQKREAREMHGVPESRVVVTGAQCYDRWFGRWPSRNRAEFVRHAGLSDERPYVLWVCSALLPGSPPEPEVVMRWAMHIRASADPRVSGVPILIRPHPSRLDEWNDVAWQRIGNVAFCGNSPLDEDSRAEYFDSLYHSAAVAGITTSAFLEAAIVGRPVMTVFSDDLRQEHEGSLHFQHLLTVGGGLLTTARTLDEHCGQLSQILAGDTSSILERQRRFVEAFIRPHGLDVPATGLAVNALEELAVSTAVTGYGRPLLGRLGLRALVALRRTPRGKRLMLNEWELQRADSQDV